MSLTTANQFDDQHIATIRKMIGNGVSESDFAIFLHQCKRTGLDPILKQIYCIPIGGRVNIITSIDGARLIAERSGNYAPGSKTEFEFDKNGNLLAATAFVKKRTADGMWHEVSATAYLSEYSTGKNLWQKMPRAMLEKCAEMKSLRRSFPSDLSGLYAREELEGETIEIVEHISKDQEEDLEKVLEGMDDFKKTVLNGLKIESFAQLPANKFDALLKRIKQVREEKDKDEVPF